MATVKAGYTEGSASITAPNFFDIKKILTVTGKEDGQPWIFCIGADSILRCYRRCADFTWAVTNLSSLLQLSGDEKVTAFDADQRGDFTAYFAVAVGSASKATGRIILFKPFETSRDFSMTIESLEALIIPSNNKITSPVLMIRLCKTSERSYPQIIISYKQADQISHAQDVARILVEDDLSSWSCQTDLTLPVNATEILDICPGSVFGDLGIFILYQVGDNKRLLFSSYAATTRTSVKCPEGESFPE
ncbi:hypothetical protein GGS24DRAFT_484220 [Hypoxylon argillaceum]|nr:hypothetical protein GGS24DRAFT_484220 [Hypoxylon argillaceum]